MSSLYPAPEEILIPTLRTIKDIELLTSIREACGWGASSLSGYLSNPDRFTYTFAGSLSGELVGMGTVEVHHPKDLSLADKNTKTCQIASLFIYPKFRSKGIGALLVSTMEQLAVSNYSARVITLNTIAHEGSEEAMFSFWEGNKNKQIEWYERRGYEVYKIAFEPVYPEWKEGMRLAVSAYLRKAVV